MVRDHTRRQPAAVCSVCYMGGANFKLWSPELTNLVHVDIGSAGEAVSLGENFCSASPVLFCRMQAFFSSLILC